MKCIVCLLALAGFARPQSFEVDSIKPSPANTDARLFGRMNLDAERLSLTAVTVENLLAQAYRLSSFQISGTAWMLSDRFDIEAKLPPGDAPAQFREMLQNLLGERFGLKTHRESRPLTGLVLWVGK